MPVFDIPTLVFGVVLATVMSKMVMRSMDDWLAIPLSICVVSLTLAFPAVIEPLVAVGVAVVMFVNFYGFNKSRNRFEMAYDIALLALMLFAMSLHALAFKNLVGGYIAVIRV